MGRGLSEVRRPGEKPRKEAARPPVLQGPPRERPAGGAQPRPLPRPLLLGCALGRPRPRTSLEPSPALGPLATGYMLGSETGRRKVRVTKPPRGLPDSGLLL